MKSWARRNDWDVVTLGIIHRLMRRGQKRWKRSHLLIEVITRVMAC